MSEIELFIDGRPVTVPAGITLAAALVRSGRTSWRRTRHEQAPRGVFCGMGVCFDCLVTVNGVPDVRACLDLVQPGDRITTELADAD